MMSVIDLLKIVCPNSTTSPDNLVNPDIVLVQAPGWGVDTVPLGLATLSTYARAKGIKILPLDVNVEWFLSRPEKFSEVWEVSQSMWFWESKDSINSLMVDYKEQAEQLIELILATNTSVVGFVMYSSSECVSLALIEMLKLRKPEITIIVGGPHAHHTMNGRYYTTLSSISAVAQGEGEEILVDIIQRVHANKSLADCPGLLRSVDGLIINNPNTFIKELDSLPIPDFSDYSFASYCSSYLLPISSCRSCPNNCIYCNERAFTGRYRFRSAESMIEELRYQMSLYPGITTIAFQDSICNGKISELIRFAELIVENRIKVSWYGQAVIRKEMTEEVLILFKKSGCVGLGYGLETTNVDLMRKLGKFTLKGVDIDKVAENHKKADLGATYNVMFGLPGESEEDAFQVLEFVRRHAHHTLLVNPSPGFCGFSEGTPGWEKPEKYSIDKKLGGTFWTSTDGANTYLTRLKRFEEFCKVAIDLNLTTTYPHRNLLNRNQVIARYYIAIGKPEKATYYYNEWFRAHPEDTTAANFLRLKGEKLEYVDHRYVALNSTDAEWINGVSNIRPEILFPYDMLIAEEMTPGSVLVFPNKDRRIIERTNVYLEKSMVAVTVAGTVLDGIVVGWPHGIQLIKAPTNE